MREGKLFTGDNLPSSIPDWDLFFRRDVRCPICGVFVDYEETTVYLNKSRKISLCCKDCARFHMLPPVVPWEVS